MVHVIVQIYCKRRVIVKNPLLYVAQDVAKIIAFFIFTMISLPLQFLFIIIICIKIECFPIDFVILIKNPMFLLIYFTMKKGKPTAMNCIVGQNENNFYSIM